MDVYATFLERLKSKYRHSPEILKIVTLISEPIQDLWNTFDFITTQMDIDSIDDDSQDSEILEFWGEILGVQRPFRQEEDLFTMFTLGEAGDEDNRHGFADDTYGGGGYLAGNDGLQYQADETAKMLNRDYKRLVLQRGALLNRQMSRRELFEYLVSFGSRCKLDDETTHIVEIDPVTYYDLSNWEKTYVVDKGLSALGVQVFFRDNIRNGDSI